MQSRARLIVVLITLINTLALFSLSACNNDVNGRPVMWDRVQVASVPVNGLTVEQARGKIILQTSGALEKVVEFRLGNQAWRSSLEGLGVTLDVDNALDQAFAIGHTGTLDYINLKYFSSESNQVIPLKYRYDKSELEAAILRVTADFKTEASESRLTVGSDGNLALIEGRSGLKIDSEDALRQLVWKLQDGYTSSAGHDDWTVYLGTEISIPTLNGFTLKELGVDRMLSSFTTHFDPGQINRTYNVRVAADAINQRIIKPGEVFSFNDVVGERSEETGYREALVIYKGEFVPGVGGGVCQVSSTLYNALLRADLKIVERNNHSLVIDYVLLGTDATVQYGSQDLKFQNDTDSNLIIQTMVDNNTLTIQLFGKKDNIPKITLTNEVIERLQPQRIEKMNPNLAVGQEKVETKGKWGARVRSYRIIGEGENSRREVLNNDTYQAIDEVVQVGTKSQPAEPVKIEPPSKGTQGAETNKTQSTTGSNKSKPGNESSNPNPAGSKP